MDIFISHRGNLKGPSLERENTPGYIDVALAKGFLVEIDAWFVEGNWYLGHDQPEVLVSEMFFLDRRESLVVHAKNHGCYRNLIEMGSHFFFHEFDSVILTSNLWLWSKPGASKSPDRIEVCDRNIPDDPCRGVCSDFIEDIRKDLRWV